jgi:hypothetical protein
MLATMALSRSRGRLALAGWRAAAAGLASGGLGSQRRLSADIKQEDKQQQPPAQQQQQPPSWLEKARGVPDAKPPPVADTDFVMRSGAGAFVAMGSLALLDAVLPNEYVYMLGSFGASAVLLYAAPAAPFSQPRNVIGGHLISALAGVSAYKLCTVGLGVPLLAPPVSVAVAIMLMQKTNTVHPPAGGTALITAAASPVVQAMGYTVLAPTLLGSSFLVFSACLINNIFRGKMRYPQWW